MKVCIQTDRHKSFCHKFHINFQFKWAEKLIFYRTFEHGPSDAKFEIMSAYISFSCTLKIKFTNNFYEKHRTQTSSVDSL